MRRPHANAAVSNLGAGVRFIGSALWLPRELGAARRLTAARRALPPQLAVLGDESAEILYVLESADLGAPD